VPPEVVETVNSQPDRDLLKDCLYQAAIAASIEDFRAYLSR
jgi:hypothetical protein